MGLATRHAAARHPAADLRDVPGAEADDAAPRRRPLGRPAAAARDRPRAGDAGRKLLILDEPTEGIQPSIIKDIERAIRALADGRASMAILLVEQYYDFARSLADQYLRDGARRDRRARRGRRHGARRRARNARSMMSPCPWMPPPQPRAGTRTSPSRSSAAGLARCSPRAATTDRSWCRRPSTRKATRRAMRSWCTRRRASPVATTWSSMPRRVRAHGGAHDAGRGEVVSLGRGVGAAARDDRRARIEPRRNGCRRRPSCTTGPLPTSHGRRASKVTRACSPGTSTASGAPAPASASRAGAAACTRACGAMDGSRGWSADRSGRSRRWRPRPPG